MMDSFQVSAPTRIDLAGGTLDLWPLYTFLGNTKTINCAIDLRATADFTVEHHSVCKVEISNSEGDTFLFYEPLSNEALEKVDKSLRFPVAILSRYLSGKESLPKLFIRMKLATEAPLRSGLGGSSTLSVAIVRGLSRIFGDFTDQGWRLELMQWVKDLEAGYLKTPTGTQDYLAALYGGLNVFNFSEGKITRGTYEERTLKDLSERLLILFSGEMHHSGLSNWEIFKNAVEGNSETLKGLAAIKKVADTLDQELRSSTCNWKTVGQLFKDEWATRKNLFHVATPRLSEITDFLDTKNVLGSKVCGAAAGGSLIALVEPSQKAKLAAQCKDYGIQVLETSLSSKGVAITEKR
jgi:D-glycero-alpha-D-manno-heptose-7-phosphate kinase